MRQSSRNGIQQYLDFGDSQQDDSNPINGSTNDDASQSDDPTRQTPRRLDPEPQADTHSQRCDRAGNETTKNIYRFDTIQSPAHEDE